MRLPVIFFFASGLSDSTLADMKTLLLSLMILLVCLPTLLPAQALQDEFPRAQSLFAQAQRLMREGDYPGAIDAYNELVKGFKNSEYRDVYQYGLARAYYNLGDFKQAEFELLNYPTLFPNSYLLPYAYHLRANCRYRSGQLESSFQDYIEAYRDAGDDRLRNLSERSIMASVEAGYFPADSILSQVPADLLCPVKARMAFLMRGNWGAATVDSFMTGCAQNLYKKQEKPKKTEGALSVGILLPLSGPYAKYGQMILDGAMLAAEELKTRGIPLEMMVYDTRADNVTAARQALLLGEAGVDLIIGPLLSNVAATTAAAMNCQHVPILVPAATQAGFTDLSPHCFQMSTNMVTIGRGMAKYAVNNRGMTTLVVIAPTSVDELILADAFVEEARLLGANILAYERFRPGETDFGPYIKDIKDAVMGSVDDSTFFVTLEGDTLRPGEVAVEFDGMFIPATEQQLFLLLPQLDFYRINTFYLGTDEWNSPNVLKLGEKVLRNAVFYSSKAAVTNSIDYDAFSTAFDTKYGTEPDRLSALGYDGIQILADAYRDGRRGPGDMAEFLHSLSGYEKVSGKISFELSRSNLELPLFTLIDGKVVPITERVLIEPADTAPPPDSVATQYIKYEY